MTELQQAALTAVNSVIHDLGMHAGVDTRYIYEVVIAGNSTMQQLLCGLDPSALGEVPFVQTFDEGLTIPARELGLAVNSGAEVFLFPQIGGFVGGVLAALAGLVVKSILGNEVLTWPRNYGILFAFSFVSLAIAYIAMSCLRLGYRPLLLLGGVLLLGALVLARTLCEPRRADSVCCLCVASEDLR